MWWRGTPQAKVRGELPPKREARLPTLPVPLTGTTGLFKSSCTSCLYVTLQSAVRPKGVTIDRQAHGDGRGLVPCCISLESGGTLRRGLRVATSASSFRGTTGTATVRPFTGGVGS